MIKYFDLFTKIYMAIIITINVIMLASYSESHGDKDKDPKFIDLAVYDTKVLFYVLGAMCLLLCLMILIPTISIHISRILVDVNLSYKGKIDKISKESRSIAELTKDKIIMAIMNTIKITVMLISNLSILYFLISIVFIVLGLVWHPSYYAFLITYIAQYSISMKNLLKAIWEPRVALLTTLLLMLIIVYLFAVVGYRAFENNYPDNS